MRQYSAEYSVNGTDVSIRRQYVSTMPRGYCPPENLPAVREMQKAVLKDLRSQIRFTPP